MRLLFALFLSTTFGFGQVIDFENLPHLQPGDPVGEITLNETGHKLQFYIGYSLKDTLPMRIQKVGFNSNKGGFYGPDAFVDCNGNQSQQLRANTINAKNYTLNPDITNRERVGCHFISAVLEAEVIPSIFILYNKAIKECSADLLDLDGHENTIEAYDIYCYATAEDYPLNPVNIEAIEVRSVGQTFGSGLIGDNGGVMPLKINLPNAFTIIEIRPIQQVHRRNDLRTVFGFALDNFSPIALEEAPFIPPYLSGELTNDISIINLDKPIIKEDEKAKQFPAEDAKELVLKHGVISVYFDFDAYGLTEASKKSLKPLLELCKSQPNILISLIGYTDPKGSNAYNLILSENRVMTVYNYLLKNGIDSNKITSNFRGENYNGVGKTDEEKRTVEINYNYEVLE